MITEQELATVIDELAGGVRDWPPMDTGDRQRLIAQGFVGVAEIDHDLREWHIDREVAAVDVLVAGLP